VCLALRAGRPAAPAEEHRKYEQRCSEHEDQQRSQQQIVMPEVDEHDFFPFACNVEAVYSAPRKERVNSVARRVKNL